MRYAVYIALLASWAVHERAINLPGSRTAHVAPNALAELGRLVDVVGVPPARESLLHTGVNSGGSPALFVMLHDGRPSVSMGRLWIQSVVLNNVSL